MEDKEKFLVDMKKTLRLGGGADKVSKQHQQGKLTARERLEILLDKDSFVEQDLLIKHRSSDFGLDKQELPGDGVITGYGMIDGRTVFVFAQDFTVAGGSLGEMHAKKIVKIQEAALKYGAPLIGINDSGGARIQEGIDSLKGYGEIFFQNTISSGVIPQISIILGPCAGGAVYSPALTDFTIMSKTAYMFITGPQVIKAVTHENVSFEELGGVDVHSQKSGNVHLAAIDDKEALLLARKLLSYLPSNNSEDTIIKNVSDPTSRLTDSIKDIIPTDSSKSYDMRKLIKEILDYNDFFEIQEVFAPNIIIGFGTLGGIVVGVIANQPIYLAGVLDINSSDKASRFIRFCDCFNIPLLSLVDVPGYMPGKDQEYGGIIRHGAKLLYAYSEATVPKITLIVRKAYGGAYIAMSSKHLGGDYVFGLPTTEVAVMGPEGAADIIFKKEIESSINPEETRTLLINEYKNKYANPYVAAERGYLDDVLEFSQVRNRLYLALRACLNKREFRPTRKHGNIPL